MTSPQWAAAVEAAAEEAYVRQRGLSKDEVRFIVNAALPHLDAYFRAQFSEELARKLEAEGHRFASAEAIIATCAWLREKNG